MGCDIHCFAEVKKGDKWEKVGDVFPLNEFNREWMKKTHHCEPFECRNYGVFGFLANVRNYSHVPVIAEATYSIPADCSREVAALSEEWDGDGHTHSFLTLTQLLGFDYEQVFWDRRVTKQTAPDCWNGAALADEGEGEHKPVREFLGTDFFADLDVLKSLGAPDDVRIIFWFDN